MRRGGRKLLYYLPALLCIAVLAVSYLQARTPLIVSVAYIAFSLLSFLLYAKDKWAAQRDAGRTPENTLHMLALLGGWPGAIFAQQLFRHKTQKASFRIRFWITVVLNSAVLIWLHTEPGANYLNSLIANV